MPVVHVGASPVHGRGLFATVDLEAGMQVGTWSLLVIDGADPVWGSGSLIEHYVFEMSDGSGALVLGSASLLNHADEPNCRAHLDEVALTLTVLTAHAILAGDELFISYGDDYWGDERRSGATDQAPGGNVYATSSNESTPVNM